MYRYEVEITYGARFGRTHHETKTIKASDTEDCLRQTKSWMDAIGRQHPGAAKFKLHADIRPMDGAVCSLPAAT